MSRSRFYLKLILIYLSFYYSNGSLTIDRAEVKVMEPSLGTCEVTINPGPPKSVSYDVHANQDAKDIMLHFGAFSMIDGKFNEIIESDQVSICNMGKSDNPLVAFIYKEMSKVGNLTSACPITKGYYYMHGLQLYESDVPIPLPGGSFKLEVNGSIVGDDNQLKPIFTSDIYFTEVKSE